tara:strand:+ start:272 stop:535 length:264 start_codon:yes stop_codon:yes gene_type:complete
MKTYFQEQQAIVKDRKWQFEALLKIYIGLGDLVDLKRVGREEPRDYIQNLLELSGVDDMSFWDWFLDHQGTWEEFVDAYCKEDEINV